MKRLIAVALAVLIASPAFACGPTTSSSNDPVAEKKKRIQIIKQRSKTRHEQINNAKWNLRLSGIPVDYVRPHSEDSVITQMRYEHEAFRRASPADQQLFRQYGQLLKQHQTDQREIQALKEEIRRLSRQKQ
jgi:hypothetical protein